MRTVKANGIEISYTVEGAGPPLVMLHGASSSSLEDWAAQRPLFRKAFRIHLPDARGHARTRWDVRDGFSRDMLVDDLLAFADALNLATFHVVGFSMGAMTALAFATRYPERLRTAVICGIDVAREPRASVARRLMDPERIEREEREWAAQLQRRHGAVQGAGAWKSLMRAIATDVADQPLLTAEDLRRVRLPVLLAYGDRDVFVPVDHAVSIYRQLPDARLLVAPDSPHQVMVSQANLFNHACAAFYRSTEAVARERAERGARRAAAVTNEAPLTSGAAVLDPAGVRSAETTHSSDPFSNWWRGRYAMPITLLALYRRPEGGDEALAAFMRRYRAEHLPLIAQVPGLRRTVVEETVEHYAGEDIVLTARMEFDDRAALDAGMASDEMRTAGRNLREIAPGLLTLLAVEERPV
ncbi:MAG: alpha/beta fold hydrolase [Chloroflexota bacterium]|nr:alpha/beta fold hydrolase [Chloroflexota bacterium]